MFTLFCMHSAGLPAKGVKGDRTHGHRAYRIFGSKGQDIKMFLIPRTGILTILISSLVVLERQGSRDDAVNTVRFEHCSHGTR
jgi:hypothetical protein